MCIGAVCLVSAPLVTSSPEPRKQWKPLLVDRNENKLTKGSSNGCRHLFLDVRRYERHGMMALVRMPIGTYIVDATQLFAFQ